MKYEYLITENKDWFRKENIIKDLRTAHEKAKRSNYVTYIYRRKKDQNRFPGEVRMLGYYNEENKYIRTTYSTTI